MNTTYFSPHCSDKLILLNDFDNEIISGYDNNDLLTTLFEDVKQSKCEEEGPTYETSNLIYENEFLKVNPVQELIIVDDPPTVDVVLPTKERGANYYITVDHEKSIIYAKTNKVVDFDLKNVKAGDHCILYVGYNNSRDYGASIKACESCSKKCAAYIPPKHFFAVDEVKDVAIKYPTDGGDDKYSKCYLQFLKAANYIVKVRFSCFNSHLDVQNDNSLNLVFKLKRDELAENIIATFGLKISALPKRDLGIQTPRTGQQAKRVKCEPVDDSDDESPPREITIGESWLAFSMPSKENEELVTRMITALGGKVFPCSIKTVNVMIQN